MRRSAAIGVVLFLALLVPELEGRATDLTCAEASGQTIGVSLADETGDEDCSDDVACPGPCHSCMCVSCLTLALSPGGVVPSMAPVHRASRLCEIDSMQGVHRAMDIERPPSA